MGCRINIKHIFLGLLLVSTVMTFNNAFLTSSFRGYAQNTSKVVVNNTTNHTNNGSNCSNTTDIQFPVVNITGYDLNNWTSFYYSNYTYMYCGYWMNVSGFRSYLQTSNDNVYGVVSLNIMAFGNDTAYPCYSKQNCPQIVIYSNATFIVDGILPSDRTPDIVVDHQLRINYTDIQNFLRGYYYTMMVPTMMEYFNISSNTTNATIYIPDYSNTTQITINCENQPFYCSGADNQSGITIQQVNASNLSITLSSQGTSYLNGVMTLNYSANFINFTRTYGGKETIVSYLQGFATIDVFGTINSTRCSNSTYNVTVNTYSYPSVTFDRSHFVQNAVQMLFESNYSQILQSYINGYLQGNSTNSSTWANQKRWH